ncbi:unnamed protein product [Cunninghamella echinulata]
MKMGPSADPAFRKHFNQLKEQATTESTVLRVKDLLKQSNDYLEKALDDIEESKSKLNPQQLEKLGKSMGLMCFIDTSQKDTGDRITTITLGGTIIVVDIDIDDDGKVHRAKVTFVPENLQNDADEKLDKLLARNLEQCDYEQFRRNLGMLALLDKLNVEHSSTDFFSIVRGLYKDMQTTCDHEKLLLSNNTLGVLLEGHGIPSLYLNYPSVSIAYWIDKGKSSTIDWDDVGNHIESGKHHPSLSEAATLFISFEESKSLHQFLPPHRSNYMLSSDEIEDDIKLDEFKVIKETKWPKFMQPLRYVKTLSTCLDASPIPVRFVAKLDTPLPTSDTIIQKLMEITGIISSSNTSASLTDRLNPSSFSLEELLVEDLSKDNNDKTNLLKLKTAWSKKLDDSTNQVYQWIPNTGTPAKLLHRIPFQHPAQIYSIIQLLRQQQTFNLLLTSIFNKNTYASGVHLQNNPKPFSLNEILIASQNNKELRIEMTTFNSPRTIQLFLSPPPTSNHIITTIPIIIDIPKERSYEPSIRLGTPTENIKLSEDQNDNNNNNREMIWNPSIFDINEMNKILRQSLNIPQFIEWFWQILKQNNSENYLLERQILKRSHTSMMDLDDAFLDSKSIKME